MIGVLNRNFDVVARVFCMVGEGNGRYRSV